MVHLKVTVALFTVPATVTKNWFCSVDRGGQVVCSCEHGIGPLVTKSTGNILTHRGTTSLPENTTALSDRWVQPIPKAVGRVASLA